MPNEWHLSDNHTIDFTIAGKWREHPVAVTMYSYMFGAIFMGLASLYFVIKKQTSEFVIPQEVSTLVYQPIINVLQWEELYQHYIKWLKFGSSIVLVPPFLSVSLCSRLCCVHQFCSLLSPHDLVQPSSLLHTGHFLLARAGNMAVTHFYHWQILLPFYEQLVYGIPTFTTIIDAGDWSGLLSNNWRWICSPGKCMQGTWSHCFEGDLLVAYLLYLLSSAIVGCGLFNKDDWPPN